MKKQNNTAKSGFSTSFLSFLKQMGKPVYIFYTLLLVALLLFFYPIRDIYESKIITPVLSKASSNIITDIILLVIFLATVVYIWLCYRDKIKPSGIFFYWTLAFLIIYLVARFTSRYQFLSFNNLQIGFVYYTDWIILFTAGLTLLQLQPAKKKLPKSGDGKIPIEIDEPWRQGKNDLFNRKLFAKQIAEKIIATENKDGALAIGINGAWGSGKTSFLNMIKDEVEQTRKSDSETNTLLMDFYPWKSSSSKEIRKDFFAALIEIVNPADRKLSFAIKDYAGKVAEIENNIVTKSFKLFAEIFSEDVQSKDSAFKDLNEKIKKFRRQIIVFIDDIDRLNKKEVIEVLKIIRNTADFSNIIYVAAYDKMYLFEAIKEINEYNYTMYLEKIFQMEFTLPTFDSALLRTQAVRLISEKLNKHYPTEEIAYAVNFDMYGYLFTDRMIKSQRDVIRLVNSLLFDIDAAKDEIDFTDFYLLELLKIEFPAFYNVLEVNKDLFFDTYDDNINSTLMLSSEGTVVVPNPRGGFDEKLRSIGIFETRENYDSNNSKTILQYYLEKYFFDELTGKDRDLIIKLLRTLLEPRKEFTNSRAAFRYARNFHRYFTLQISSIDLSLKEFNTACRMEFSLFKTELGKWIDEGKSLLVKEYLEDTSNVAGQLEYENKVRAILNYHYFDSINKSDQVTIKLKFNSPLKMLKLPLVGDKLNYYSSPEDYKNFFYQVIEDPGIPAMEKSDFIVEFAKENNTIFSTDEIQQVCCNFFWNYYGNQDSPITEGLIHMYQNCSLIPDNEKMDHFPQGIGVLRNAFFFNCSEKNLEIFLFPTGVSDSWRFRNDLFMAIFSIAHPRDFDPNSYNMRLESPEAFYINEFMTLFNKLAEYNFTDVYVRGDLKYLNPREFYKTSIANTNK